VTGDVVSGVLNLNGFDQIIGSLSSVGTAQGSAVVALGANILTVGNDATQNAAYAGGITGSGIFRLNGNGSLQTLAVADNGAQTWSTEIADGLLNVANGARLGSGVLTLGVTGVSGADDFTGLNLAKHRRVCQQHRRGERQQRRQRLDHLVGNRRRRQRRGRSRQEYLRRRGRRNAIELGRSRRRKRNHHGDRRRSAPSYRGKLVRRRRSRHVRHAFPRRNGRPSRLGADLENNAAAGLHNIVLGDAASTIGAAVDRATLTGILGSGAWNPNGDGLSATSGGQDAAGTTGFGAFLGVGTVIDGFDYSFSP
jgi:hypothetical protein